MDGPLSSDRLRAMYAGAMRCRLQEIPVNERAPVLKQYLQQVPGARPHISVSRDAKVANFETIAPFYPVFLVTPDALGDEMHPE